MALDDTDKRLMKGLIWLAVFGLLAYVFPGFWFLPGGYRVQADGETKAKGDLTHTGEKFRKFYKPISKANFGEYTEDSVPDPPGSPMTQLKDQFSKSSTEMQQLIIQKENWSRMTFPEWTKVPEANQRDPGVYFAYMLEKKKNMLASDWYAAKVECLDPQIGFTKYTGLFRAWGVNKAEEMLRELFIAEKIITLCIKSKQGQEEFEKGHGFKQEAFMRIISVTPADSSTSGPTALIPNPQYNPEVKDPKSPSFRKYNVKYSKPFIQEYPVDMLLQCDVNTYMRFLHSVRSPGQFLVIRTLQILSPFLEDSKYDKSEWGAADMKDPNDQEKTLKVLPEHILVKMSAAGMDFFDPKTNPRGLYEERKSKEKTEEPTGGRHVRHIPAAGQQ